MPLKNSIYSLGKDFFEESMPAAAPSPSLLLWNESLARELDISGLIGELELSSVGDKEERLAGIFAGNILLPGSKPIALVYAGHQFGHFVPQLGDGRAHLLGEVEDQSGTTFDLQLKGSGSTAFSRRGDGRCALGPAVREYVMSEAMAALEVPTARSLAVVSTGEMVFRESPVPGAVVTRVAASHIRVGTFEYFAARKNIEALEALVHYAVQRHYPGIEGSTADVALHLLECVIDRQIKLVTEWMRVGFIHGVMNTDNTSISGETIDFGPCAMMGIYDQRAVYSSIDHRGRYAFGNQPSIMQWNMVRFAECLIPLLDDDQDVAIDIATRRIHSIDDQFKEHWQDMMGRKLGLSGSNPSDDALVHDLLKIMEDKKLDYTITFNDLTLSCTDFEARERSESALGQEWMALWQVRLDLEEGAKDSRVALMRNSNPAVIPRNHHVEALLQDIAESTSLAATEAFLAVLKTPYQESPETRNYQDPPADGDRHYQTFCGT